MNRRVWDVLDVTERAADAPGPFPVARGMAIAAEMSAPTSVEPGLITVRAAVTMTVIVAR